MRSLSVKVLLVVILVSLLSIALVAVSTRYATVTAYDRLLRERQKEAFITLVTDYYQQHGSWRGLYGRMVVGGGMPSHLVGFMLVDQNGRVVVATRRYQLNQVLPSTAVARGTPVLLAGERIGTVVEDTPLAVRTLLDEGYLRYTNRALLLAASGAMLLALLLGVWWARSLTRPLRELTEATRALAEGAPAPQVPVRSGDELGQLAAAFNRMSADLARATALRRQMTADIAHDLRTPLTVIKGYTEALRDGDLSPSQATFETMYQEAQLLSGLIEDLRTLSLADAGELSLNRRSVAVEELLEQARAAYLPLAQAAGITLVVELPPVLPVLNVDAERLARVLGNLISNALRHTSPGGYITLSASAGRGTVEIQVRDTGEGISPVDLPHIFERFYRGDAARQSGAGESGLGLAIAKSLVEAHGGTLTATSTLGQGATFMITLLPYTLR